MDTGTAFALGFLVGATSVCVLQLLRKIGPPHTVESVAREICEGIDNGTVVIDRPKIVPPKGGSGTAPPKHSMTWTTNAGTTYVILPWDLEDPPAGNPVKR